MLDFSAGRLEAGTAGAIAAHLQRCADCRRVLRRELRMAVLLGAVTRVAPRSDAWSRVEAAVRSAPVHRRRMGWQPIVWTAGLAAVVALAISLSGSPARTPVKPPAPDPMHAFAPNVAAGLSIDRSNDPLVVLQRKEDRALDQLAEEGS